MDYESVLEQLEQEDYSVIFEAASNYNEALRTVEFPLRNYDKVLNYYLITRKERHYD